MIYDVPGRSDKLSETLIEKWNQMIEAAYMGLQPRHGSRFFTLDPRNLNNPFPAPVKWFADPAEPDFCLGPEEACQLSDWGVRGRHVLHNEYCEYCTVMQMDADGRVRPKRIQVTTELREYWVCVAKYNPYLLRSMAQSILGFRPEWKELYGMTNPLRLSTEHREIAFSTQMAGHGNDRKLMQAGVPSQPNGRLNTENALFMTHPINGLDDLFYIVMFGAKPYARRTVDSYEPATREEIFREYNVEHLACRHADPAAAMGAYGAAFEGRTLAFANPLGMYILSFSTDIFLYQDQPVREEWVRWSRGSEGMYQRLEFGPGDEEPVFLDDIRVAVGGQEEPLTGGFQLVQNLEVGTRVEMGDPTPVREDEYVLLSVDNSPIHCEQAGICETIRNLKIEYDNAHQIVRTAPRTLGWRG